VALPGPHGDGRVPNIWVLAAAAVVDVAPPPGAEGVDVEVADVVLDVRLLLQAATTHALTAMTKTVARRLRRTAVPLVPVRQDAALPKPNLYSIDDRRSSGKVSGTAPAACGQPVRGASDDDAYGMVAGRGPLTLRPTWTPPGPQQHRSTTTDSVDDDRQ
jgi:hypothetical protein